MTNIVDAMPSREIPESGRLLLSERDSLKVIALLNNPSAPTERLVRATEADRTLG